jgi:hypothetical protein
MSEPTEQIITNLEGFINWYGCDPGVPMSAVDVANDAAKRLAELRDERDALAAEVQTRGVSNGYLANMNEQRGEENERLRAEVQTLRKALGRIAIDICSMDWPDISNAANKAANIASAHRWLEGFPALTPEQAEACVEAEEDGRV